MIQIHPYVLHISLQHQSQILLCMTQSCGAKTNLDSLEMPLLRSTEYFHREIATHPVLSLQMQHIQWKIDSLLKANQEEQERSKPCATKWVHFPTSIMLKTKPLVNARRKKYILHTEHVMLISVKSRNPGFRKIIYVQNKQLFFGIENMGIFLTGGNGIPAH